MDYTRRLHTLVLANALPANEKLIAQTLLYTSHIDLLLDQISNSDLVVVPSFGFPLDMISSVLSHTDLTVTIFPDIITGIMSVSPSETASHMSTTLCSLIKKLFPSRAIPLKGVITFHSGISVNDTPGPGALIWKLKHYGFMSFKVESLDYVIASSFTDSFTMMAKTNIRFFRSEFSEMVLTPRQLVERATDLVLNPLNPLLTNWNPHEILESIMPAAYLKRMAH